jgi:UDP-3-O-[3-hydroxymyristoyl] glucosamine N-acyltransferase
LASNPLFTFVVAQRPRLILGLLLQVFELPVWVNEGIHPTAVIDPTAILEAGVVVGPYVVVGPETVIGAGSVLYAHVVVGSQVRLGEGCLLHAGAKVADRSVLGHRVILQPNCVIGSDGFSFITPEASKHEKSANSQDSVALEQQTLLRIPSVGNVVLGDDVEVGACTTIDRGTLAETRVGQFTKFDNLVQVGHNNTIGDACLIVSQVGIAGSCTIGNGVVMAGQAGLADHLTIGDGAIIMAKAGVMNDVPAGDTVVGAPAYSKRKAFQIMMGQEKLPEVLSDYKKLKKRFEQLEQQAKELEGVLSQFKALQGE